MPVTIVIIIDYQVYLIYTHGSFHKMCGGDSSLYARDLNIFGTASSSHTKIQMNFNPAPSKPNPKRKLNFLAGISMGVDFVTLTETHLYDEISDKLKI